MSVIINVDNKIEYILSLMKNPFTEDEFLAKFKETYPEDYEKCWKKFKKEEMNTKKEKHTQCNTPTNILRMHLNHISVEK